MPIIFGWGRQIIKQIGITFKNFCSHCNNEEYWILTRITTWFTIFFIPIIPYSIKYFLSCPVCKYGLTLDQKQLEEIKPIAEANQLLIEGKITQDEYQARINQIHGGLPDLIQAEVVETKTLPESVSMSSFCPNCGQQITEESKFCGNCGASIISK